MEASKLDGVLDSLSTTKGVKELVQVARSDGLELVTELGTGLGGKGGCNESKLGSLVLDSLDHTLVVVANVGAHKLGVHVGVAVAISIPEVDAIGAAIGKGGEIWVM